LTYLDSYTKTGEYSLEFKLTKPDAIFLLELSSTRTAPLSPSSLKLPQTVLESGGPELAGIGPFVVTTFTPNTEIVFDRRADYAWAPASITTETGAAYLDRVVVRTLPEGSTRTGAIQQGQVQIASDIQPLDVSLFEGQAGFQYLVNPVGGTPYAYYFNVNKPPFDDIRVRQAFVSGFDLSVLLTSIYQNAFTQAQIPLSIASPYAATQLGGWVKPDFAKSNALLDEAGWTERDANGIRVKNGVSLTVRIVSAAPFVRESRDQLAVAIAAALKQNVGIALEFQIEDLGTESERAAANDYEIFDNSFGGDDPAACLDRLYSSTPGVGLLNRGHVDDQALNELLITARFTSDFATRSTAYTAAQQLIIDQTYSLPIYQTQDNLAALNSVHNITIDSTGQPFGAYTIWIDQE
jgi:peptide/nickel transport system substrate-binding protein